MLPLTDRRILVTRAKGQASALADQLTSAGATAILIPTIELAPPASYTALDDALSSLVSFDWLLFTSANAVEAFAERARQLNITPSPKRIAAIGPATAKAAQGIGLRVDLIPEHFVSEAFVKSLLPYCAGASMLLVRAAVARDLLPQALTNAGAKVTIAEAYQSVIPQESMKALGSLLETEQLDAITFTSASTAQNLAALLSEAKLKLPDSVVLASIGPITSQAMRELGLQPTLEALTSTIPALVAVLNDYYTT